MTSRGGVVCALLTIDQTERLSTTHVQSLYTPRKATMKISNFLTNNVTIMHMIANAGLYSLLLARGRYYLIKYHDKQQLMAPGPGTCRRR
jgi:hypothetical protein